MGSPKIFENLRSSSQVVVVSRLVLLSLAFAVLATGCSTTVRVTMKGGPEMNGGGKTAEVHVYELNSQGNFGDLTPDQFWNGPGVKSSVRVRPPRTRTVYPDWEETFEFEVSDETTFIGVAANLRDPDEDKWRALYPVEEVGDWLSLSVSGSQISVEVEGEGTLDKIRGSAR